MTGRPMTAICRTLRIGRATAYRTGGVRATRYRRREDAAVHAQLKAVLRDRGSYGYRRATVLVNRAFATGYNRKRVQRVMQLTGLALPVRARRRGTRPHTGRVCQTRSDQRWCSDAFEIACWNGEVVRVMFALDCHDREVLSTVGMARALVAADVHALMRQAVAGRCGANGPVAPIQWLTDNGSVYTALTTVLEADRLGLVPITTPAASPESNGMAEAFVNTMRRDYVDGAELSSAARVLEQLSTWIDDYNQVAPHSALGYQAPAAYRRMMVTP